MKNKEDKRKVVSIYGEDLAFLYEHINNMRPKNWWSWFNAFFKRKRDDDIEWYIERANVLINSMLKKATNDRQEINVLMAPTKVSAENFLKMLKS